MCTHLSKADWSYRQQLKRHSMWDHGHATWLHKLLPVVLLLVPLLLLLLLAQRPSGSARRAKQITIANINTLSMS